MKTTLKSLDYLTKNSLNNLTPTKTHPQINQVLTQILEEKDYAKNSRIAFGNDLKCFLEWYSVKNGELFSFDRLTSLDISGFRDDLKKEGKSPATINRRLVSIRTLCSVAFEMDLLNKNPASKVKQVPVQSLSPKGLKQQECRQLLKELELRGEIRNTLIIELMLSAGLRVSEVIVLEVSDLQISDRKGDVTVRYSKGQKTRKVPLNKRLRSLLAEYLNFQKPSGLLFMGQRGALATPIAVNQIVERYSSRLQLKFSPHTLRHTFAYNYLKTNPGDIVGLSQILGHSNINTTAIYTQNRLEDLQEKVEAVSY